MKSREPVKGLSWIMNPGGAVVEGPALAFSIKLEKNRLGVRVKSLGILV